MQPLLWGTALLLLGALTYRAPALHEAHAHQPPQPFAGVLDEHPAIQYATRQPRDRVAQLNRAVRQGSVTLTYREPGGYLQAVLEALAISRESQLLVFSKTGIQRASTSPDNPRALFFDDSVVIGYIPGARLIEIAAHDPEQGVVFYTVDQMVTRPDGSQRDAVFERRTSCLTCHVSGSTLDVPGMITRSNFASANGDVIPQLGFHIVDHRTPLSQRWGGWFVTGNYVAPPYGGVGHMGNVSTTRHPTRGDVASMSNELLTRWMDSAITERGYVSHESDIAALMVFDHQMRAVNLLTRLNWEARVAASDGTIDFTSGALQMLAHDVADYFLFVDEVSPPARLTPRAGFAAAFTAAGPRDSHGRSLRELDLEQRLLRYPCSYMIYSAAFDQLPHQAKAAVYQRIAAILSARDDETRYWHLSADDRRAIIEILRQTKPDWPGSP
ncbi:MAG TPA: hypothetical protein VMO26_06395 [Vicinamibacterales bacterium]|nr:hypothetical protein [Vicinamibacterales bacterium]